MTHAPEPVFEDPWHAQLFAVTVHLSERGHFSWPDWTAVFAAVLAEEGVERELNGGSDYFDAWLIALERLLNTKGLALPEEVEAQTQAWRAAYLTTPHGVPVRLPQ